MDSGAEIAGAFAIMMTGLPAGGKSTLGRALAALLGRPLLDKDDFLVELFESEGIGDAAWRRRLSIAADARFQTAAADLDGPVLISHWRPAHGPADTGTPTDWLSETFDHLLEVHCACPPEVAAARFAARRRHPGHLDDHRSPEKITAWMTRLAPGYPLWLGPVVTAAPEDAPQAVAGRVRRHIQGRLSVKRPGWTGR